MSRYIYTLVILLLCIHINAQERLVIDKVIAKVGSQTVLLSDIEAQFAFSKDKEIGMSENEAKCFILESMIGQKLIVHQAKIDSVEVSRDEVNAQLDFKVDAVLRQMQGDEEFFKEYYGFTPNQMKENLRDDLEQQLIAERMQLTILDQVNITPAEVEAFFEKIPKDSIPFMSAEVEIAELVLKPEINEEERTKALKTILDIKKKIQAGDDFAELAKIYSDDPGSGSRGGDLGFVGRGTFVTEFEATAYALEENEISDPVETEFGFHIIEMLERRGNKIHARHILIEPEITSADMDLTVTRLDSIKSEIDSGIISFEEAIKKYSTDDIQSFHTNGRVQNPQTGKTFFTTNELPPEVYFATEDLDVNDITEPLEYPQPTGDTYYRIVKLQKRTNPHIASLEQDYTKIQQFAKESKKSEYFNEWVQKRLKSTFIEVDENYLTCPNLDELESN